MTLFREQVRVLASEQNLINVTATYTRNDAAWGTLHDYGNVTVAAASLLIFSFACSTASCYRLKIGSVYAAALDDATGSPSGAVYVAAGTYDVLVEQRNGGVGGGQVDSMKMGAVVFNDAVGNALAAYSTTISKTVAARQTCIGSLNSAVFAVRCFAYTSGGQTNFKNVGDSLTNGVALAVDGTQISWYSRVQDASSREAAEATYYVSLSVGSAHTFAITKDNAATVVHISVYACPWLLAPSTVRNQPVTPNFKNGSTLYVMLEPLWANNSKGLTLGKQRAISFGDATDYYYVPTPAVGLMSCMYTFELVEVSEAVIAVYGEAGCISQIGVDMS